MERERVNFMIDSKIREKLRQRSKQTGIPMSRILENACREYLDMNH